MVLASAVLCLSLAIHFESRGETLEGQRAVAQVVINRSKNNKTTICKEVFKKGQFSWTKRPYQIPSKQNPTWKKTQHLAFQLLQNPPVQLKSTFFKNKRSKVILAPRLVVERVIGNHIFYFQKVVQK